VPLGTGGAFDIFVTNATNLFIDVNGYYLAPSALALGAGTASAPSLTFSNDTNTGLYSPSAGTVKVTASGNDILTVGSSGISVNGNVDLTGSITQNGNNVLQVTGSNMALGDGALASNTTGTNNLAAGGLALYHNTTGRANIAVGDSALQFNTTGALNTAVGLNALSFNTTADANSAFGAQALESNITGRYNTALGTDALCCSASGSNNIAVGFAAAQNVTNDNSNNIHIGTQGASADNGTIRIGGNTGLGDPATQTQFFASGIYGTTTGASGALPVVVDSNGQLGTTSSSRAVKRDIEDMGDTTDTLMSLRPVRFRYKVYGPDSPFQYGLVAEEVAEVAPELAARNNDGKIETVFYDKVNAMLLNQVQTQQRMIEEQNEAIRRLESRLAELESRAR